MYLKILAIESRVQQSNKNDQTCCKNISQHDFTARLQVTAGEKKKKWRMSRIFSPLFEARQEYDSLQKQKGGGADREAQMPRQKCDKIC